MNNQERSEWLKSLKVGDTVICFDRSGWNRYTRMSKYTIAKITPKGRIRLNNDVLLDDNGSNYNQGYYICPYDDSIKEYEAYLDFARKCSNIITTMDKVVNINKGLLKYYSYRFEYLPKDKQDEIIKKLEECCNLILDIDN